jgi:hypothetical protein
MVVTHAGRADHLNERRDLHSGLAVTTQHKEWLPAQRPWGHAPRSWGPTESCRRRGSCDRADGTSTDRREVAASVEDV